MFSSMFRSPLVCLTRSLMTQALIMILMFSAAMKFIHRGDLDLLESTEKKVGHV